MLGKKLKELRASKNFSMADLMNELNKNYNLSISKSMISRWENDIVVPATDYLIAYADYFNADLNWLMDNKKLLDAWNKLATPRFNAELNFIKNNPNVVPENMNYKEYIPILGSIPAGAPIFAKDNIEGYIDLPTYCNNLNEFFALKVKGDSMYPKYQDGDVVIIHEQCNCENGEECAVRVNGSDATLKKIVKTDNSIILQPLNPTYTPIVFSETGEVEIIGKVIEIRRRV